MDLAELQCRVDEVVGDGYQVEILDGRIIVNPPASRGMHDRMITLIVRWLSERAPAPLLVYGQGTGVWQTFDGPYMQPDVTVISDALPRVDKDLGSTVHMIGEVCSPGQYNDEYTRAVAIRAKDYGVEWLFVVNVNYANIRWFYLGKGMGAGPPWTEGFEFGCWET